MTLALATQLEPILRSKGIDPEDVTDIVIDGGESARLGHPVIVVKMRPRVEKIQVDIVELEAES